MLQDRPMNANNSALKKIIPSKETLVLAGILVSMVLFFQFFTSTFIDKANLVDILKEASKLCIISFGMAIIIAGGGIDLSLGHIAGFSAIIATTIKSSINVNPFYNIAFTSFFIILDVILLKINVSRNLSLDISEIMFNKKT